MRGDFSRIRFHRGKHYTSVLQQQGRVSLDADGNEQCAINEYIRDREAIDIIGLYGGPIGDEGFQITVNNDAISIGPGRYYVHGILCENAQSLGYTSQPFLININPTSTDSELLDELSSGAATAIQVYLEVWRRLVTALDDPCLREPALGQADTTARVQTVWRVVAESVAATPTSQPTPVVRGKLSATTADGSGDCSCQPTPAAGYRGLENQLYRIEIHQGGSEATATFKWSRENGSIVVAVLGVAGSNVQVDSLGPDANLGFSTGQWVEITDDSYLFGQPPNQFGDLYQIQLITPEQLNITMTQPVSQVDKTKNARLRRWDQFGASAGSTGVPLSAGTWLELENGIQVQFTTGQYQSGDSWVIPARTASGQIDWPPCESDGSQFQPGHRTEVFRAPLACIHWNSTSQSAVVENCRRSFPPLTDLTSNVLSAIHVTQISWSNDDVMTLDQLVVNGLTVSLDQAVTGDVDGGNFIVSLEIPEIPPGAGQLAPVKQVAATTVLRGVSTLDGPISASTNPASILWQLPEGVFLTPFTINLLLLPGAQYGLFGRVRVKLVGHALFATTSAGQIFLDGQSFGTPAFRADGSTPRIDLQLPSGNAQKASDFESWFYLAPFLAVTAVSIQNPSLSLITDPSSPGSWTVVAAGGSTPVTQQGTVTLSYPPAANTTVTLSIVSTQTDLSVSSYVSVPATVTVPMNQTTSNTFTVSVIGNPWPLTVNYSVVASLQSAFGPISLQSQPLSLTGFSFTQ